MASKKINPGQSSLLRGFLASEAAAGGVLTLCAALALLIANSGFGETYQHALHIELAGLSLLHWIDDGLMALFFLLVGLEIKRELFAGHLKTWPARLLPGVAAAGGMLAPALVYVAFNAHAPETLRGWAVPTATDIAFSLAVLALLGRRAPTSLKVFLTALAIIDDLGAIIIIALIYTAQLSPLYAGLAAGLLLALTALNRAGVKSLAPYLLLGAALWFCMLKSGVHATIAGVALALTIPVGKPQGVDDAQASPLHSLEHALQPWVAYGVLPLFGFANAGVVLGGGAGWFADNVLLGVAAGLFLGKQAGVFGAVWLARRLRLVSLPAGVGWAQIYGVALLCGIGFTMSIFIGFLAFGQSAALETSSKAGVLLGSLASALAGALVLMLAKSAAAPGRQ